MIWKKTILLCIVSMGALSAWVNGQQQQPSPKSTDPAKTALIEEMMGLTHPERMMTQFLQQFKVAFSKGLEDSFRNQLSKSNEDITNYQPQIHRFEDQIFDLIADRMSWGKIKPKFVALYDVTFSKQELEDIVAFYQTPSGQSLLQKMPELVAQGSQIGQAQMSGATPEIQKLTSEFMESLRKAHQGGTNRNQKE